MLVNCPLYNDAHYTYTISIDDEVFTMEFLWVERAGFWALSLFDSDEQTIFLNLFMIPGQRLSTQYNFSKPVGDFTLVPYEISEIVEDNADLRDIADSHFLIYDSEA